MLAVAVSAHAPTTTLAGEATLSRELPTSPLPGTQVPVEYRWQNSGCCQPILQPQHSYSRDIVSHPPEPVLAHRPLPSATASHRHGHLRTTRGDPLIRYSPI